ncbi:hypothetical protein ALP24_200040 [Pseudomonas syringae pv. aptata]|uniref:Uncharacterized protein n=1 Tax=Pseudomonas syringae pv. aptata TaxID=83167 RepID=A0A3M5WKH6_PSEAP|nr:hypothetical protein ALP24_200040 [Pseudomonas syringae pv. aptata]
MLAGASAATCFSVPRSCLHSANSAVIAGRALGRGRSVALGVSELACASIAADAGVSSGSAGTGARWGAMAVRGFQRVRTESVAFTSGSVAVTSAVPGTRRAFQATFTSGRSRSAAISLAWSFSATAFIGPNSRAPRIEISSRVAIFRGFRA